MTFYYSEISKQTDAAELSLTFLSMWLTMKTIVPCFAGSLVRPTFVLLVAGAQPQQDPGGTLRMNGIGEREETRETSLDRAKSARERERKRKKE